jgi:hypothetical protein
MPEILAVCRAPIRPLANGRRFESCFPSAQSNLNGLKSKDLRPFWVMFDYL